MIAVVVQRQRDLHAQPGAQVRIERGAGVRLFIHGDGLERFAVVAAHLQSHGKGASGLGE